MEGANERKRLKYQEFTEEECRRRGWKACCETVEVGFRGFATFSFCKTYTTSQELQRGEP